MDQGAWWARVYGIDKSHTRLSTLESLVSVGLCIRPVSSPSGRWVCSWTCCRWWVPEAVPDVGPQVRSLLSHLRLYF